MAKFVNKNIYPSVANYRSQTI